MIIYVLIGTLTNQVVSAARINVNIGCFDTREGALRAQETIRAHEQKIPECDIRDGIASVYEEMFIQEIPLNHWLNDFNPEVPGDPTGQWERVFPSITVSTDSVNGPYGHVAEGFSSINKHAEYIIETRTAK